MMELKYRNGQLDILGYTNKYPPLGEIVYARCFENEM